MKAWQEMTKCVLQPIYLRLRSAQHTKILQFKQASQPPRRKKNLTALVASFEDQRISVQISLQNKRVLLSFPEVLTILALCCSFSFCFPQRQLLFFFLN